MSDPALHERRILVVEDEYLVAEELAQELADVGALVLGPVSSVESALALLDGEARPDGAILDVNLGGERVFPLADTLIDRSVPMIFITGYDPATLSARFERVPVCEKPFKVSRIIDAIGKAIHV